MSYEATIQKAIAAYIAAVVSHHNIVANTVDLPGIEIVEQTGPGKYRIKGKTPSWPPAGFCNYEERTGVWSVSLLDGAIVRVRDSGDGFVVVSD